MRPRSMQPWNLALATTRLAGLFLLVTFCISAACNSNKKAGSNSDGSLSLSPAIFDEQNEPTFAVSPDGSQMVYIAQTASAKQLFLRSTGRGASKLLAGTDGAGEPFFSPDGKSVGFFAAGKLKRVALQSGTVQEICDAPQGRGATWTDDEKIIFTPTLTTGLWEVPAAGGAPNAITELNEDRGHRWPDALPGGKGFIFTLAKGGSWDDATIVAQDSATGKRNILVEGGTFGRYTTSGHLVYAKGGTLYAAPFDISSLTLTGSPTPILEGVMEAPRAGAAQFSIARNGTLVYLAGAMEETKRNPVWVNRDGTAEVIPISPRSYIAPRLSPDGKQLAIGTEDINFKIFVYTFAAGALKELETGASSTFPVWSPDGRSLAFRSTKGGAWNLYSRIVEGPVVVDQISTSPNLQEPCAWSPDGKLLAFIELDPKTGRDIRVVDTSGVGPSRPVIQSPSDEGAAKFSPNGKWLAYTTKEASGYEVYVQPFPGPGPKHKISIAGGAEPVWSPTGKEIFFIQQNDLMAVDVVTAPQFSASAPKKLFDAKPYVRGLATRPNYDATADGKRFIMVQETPKGPSVNKMVVATNWFEELQKKAPIKKQ